LETATKHAGSKRPKIDEEKARGLFRAAIERKVSSRSPRDEEPRVAAETTPID
jgi:hypothetical protein